MLGGVNKKSSRGFWYQQPDAGELSKTAHVPAVAAAERQLRQQARRTHIQRGVATSDRRMRQRTGHKGFFRLQFGPVISRLW
jgi:hypothetical protein